MSGKGLHPCEMQLLTVVLFSPSPVRVQEVLIQGSTQEQSYDVLILRSIHMITVTARTGYKRQLHPWDQVRLQVT